MHRIKKNLSSKDMIQRFSSIREVRFRLLYVKALGTIPCQIHAKYKHIVLSNIISFPVLPWSLAPLSAPVLLWSADNKCQTRDLFSNFV